MDICRGPARIEARVQTTYSPTEHVLEVRCNGLTRESSSGVARTVLQLQVADPQPFVPKAQVRKPKDMAWEPPKQLLRETFKLPGSKMAWLSFSFAISTFLVCSHCFRTVRTSQTGLQRARRHMCQDQHCSARTSSSADGRRCTAHRNTTQHNTTRFATGRLQS